MKKVASLRYGVIFKKAFSDPVIFTAFVKAVLGIELHIDHVETEKSFASPVGPVKTSFDLFAEDKEQRIIVDIQHVRYPDHYHRFLNYHCAALLEQAVQSRDYRPALQVFTIVVLTSGDKHGLDVSVIDFDPRDLDGNLIGEIPHKVVYLCPKYLRDRTPAAYREWMRMIEDSLDEEVDETTYHDQHIQQVLDKIRQDSISPEDRARMIQQYSDEQVQQEKFTEGMKKGREEGRAEGEKKGREEEQQTLVANMSAKGLTAEVIADLTRLSVDDVVRMLGRV